MQKAGAAVLAAMEVVKIMYKYVKKLLIDGNKSRLMGSSKIDRQRDVRLRILLWKAEEDVNQALFIVNGRFWEFVKRLIWATASSNTGKLQKRISNKGARYHGPW